MIIIDHRPCRWLQNPAYIPGLEGAYLIEEPENGIHPRAVETVLQSLSSVYNAQVLLATHSPVILSLAQPEQLNEHRPSRRLA